MIFSKKSMNVAKLVIVSAMFVCAMKVSFADEQTQKIAFVDMQKLEEKATVSKDLMQKLSKKEKELQDVLVKTKNKIEADMKTLESKRAVLSTNELQQKAKKIEADYRNLQINERKYAQIFDMSKMIAIGEIQGDIRKAVNKVADKYDLILPANMALYINDRKYDDLTDKVLSQLNSMTKSVNYEKAFNKAKEQVEQIVKKQAK